MHKLRSCHLSPTPKVYKSSALHTLGGHFPHGSPAMWTWSWTVSHEGTVRQPPSTLFISAPAFSLPHGYLPLLKRLVWLDYGVWCLGFVVEKATTIFQGPSTRSTY